jgi:glycosyltransferase involved in cell wall biosynthesis
MDELSLFQGAPRSLIERERSLLEQCDLVFAGGVSLHAAKRALRPDAHCFPSSIDAAHFRRARSTERIEPADQAGLAHPRIGYFGVLDERLDRDLVAGLAAARPDWHFVMLGPVVKISAADLPQAPNIHWLGPKRYEELPDYLGGWDAGFMPFALNDATRFISPTKTPEFLAAGLPVVSTAVRDVVRSYGADGLVEIAAGPGEFAAALGRALQARDDSARLRAVDDRLATTSWDATWDAMQRLIMDRLQPNNTATAVRGDHAHV